LFYLDVGPGLEQMFLHVVHEVIEKLDLLIQVGRVNVQSVVVLTAFIIDVMDIAEKVTFCRPDLAPEQACSKIATVKSL
jgi:hypothetical protein